LFALHVSINEYKIAPAFAPLGLPEKSQFLRLCVATHKRKNWMFMGSPAGAKAGAIFYSLIETCKANNIEPYQYLCAMLNRIRGCVTEDDYRKLLPQFVQI